ncbi:uncharacterized protein [Periplaneta americana]|uniref:uncharacterized protein n=1 Tax=Periplaneta americana TaxID=6978 RepID=UPI0037E7C8ED
MHHIRMNESGLFYIDESYYNNNNSMNSDSKEDREYLDLDKLKREQVQFSWQNKEKVFAYDTNVPNSDRYGFNLLSDSQQLCRYKSLPPTSIINYQMWKSENNHTQNMPLTNDTQLNDTTAYSECSSLIYDATSDHLRSSNEGFEWKSTKSKGLEQNMQCYTSRAERQNNVSKYITEATKPEEGILTEGKKSYKILSTNRPEPKRTTFHSGRKNRFENNVHNQHDKKLKTKRIGYFCEAGDATSDSENTGKTHYVVPRNDLTETRRKGRSNVAFMKILLHEENKVHPNTYQENVVKRYQVLLPSLTQLQERKIKQEQQLEYAISQPSKRVILSRGKMGVTGAETSPTLTSSRKLQFRCQVCGERLATRNSLSTHIKSHRRPYCRYCLAVMKTNEQLKMHVNRLHPPKSPHQHVTVTSKYGRKRQVLSTLSLMKRRQNDSEKLKRRTM